VEFRLFIFFFINFIQLYKWLLMGRIIISWLPSFDTYKQPWRGLIDVTEPVMAPFRRLIPPIGGVLDISPMVLFFVIELITGMLRSVANL
jgi:YggT family protein